MGEIPREALDLHYNSSGFLPDVGLYQRGDMFYQETSKSHHWLFGIMVVGAVIVALLPWHTRAIVGELKYWIAGMLVFGGLCDVVGGMIRGAVTQHISVDAKSKTVAIVGEGFDRKLAWDQVIGLQICRQKVPGHSEMNGYQLNLVWGEADGVVQRRCLLKHSIRAFVFQLGRCYESLFGFGLIDHTRRSQTVREPGPAVWLRNKSNAAGGWPRSLTYAFGNGAMKRLGTLIILLGTVGAFFSGLVFWMANSSHQEAERLRRQGRHCDVEVLGKRTSSPGDGSSTFHYIDVKPLDRGDEARLISVSVVGNTYEQLHVGQRLKAWVLETDALLDYGPKNAAPVAQTMRLTCLGFALVMVTGLTFRMVCRTRRCTE